MLLDTQDLEQVPISAYAKLEFEQFSFFIQTLTLVVGRKAKKDDNVDVHLGMSKSISRQHAKIYYQFTTSRWEIEVLGKNGAFVNDFYLEAGGRSALNHTDRLQIADALFSFLLPEGSAEPGILPDTGLQGADIEHTPLSTQNFDLSTTPIAPHHLIDPIASHTDAIVKEVNLAQLEMSPSRSSNKQSKAASLKHSLSGNDRDSSDTMKSAKKSKRKQLKSAADVIGSGADLKVADGPAIKNVPGSQNHAVSSTTENFITKTTDEAVEDLSTKKEDDEEDAAQLAAQILHQERLARQAQDEEEGLILPPPETDPIVIANMQKPAASYATMIYNAITSHDKKKMTLAQIYSWICINHPYYRYVQNGWQNSIRHNLSLNKAFKKVPRTDDEPGKGAFWAVEPDAETLFEGGIYKKKAPRPPPVATPQRASAILVKAGKLAPNPAYFADNAQGKAEDVFRALHEILLRQAGQSCSASQTVLLTRLLSLAMAAQLKTATLDPASVRLLAQQHAQANARAFANGSIRQSIPHNFHNALTARSKLQPSLGQPALTPTASRPTTSAQPVTNTETGRSSTPTTQPSGSVSASALQSSNSITSKSTTELQPDPIMKQETPLASPKDHQSQSDAKDQQLHQSDVNAESRAEAAPKTESTTTQIELTAKAEDET